MSGIVAEYLVDTDVLVDHLRGASELTFDQSDTVRYSTITRCELFTGTRQHERQISDVLDAMIEVDVTRAIAERAGRLRRSLPIRTTDALIAATAIEFGALLVTRNVRDFEGVPGLTVHAPQR